MFSGWHSDLVRSRALHISHQWKQNCTNLIIKSCNHRVTKTTCKPLVAKNPSTSKQKACRYKLCYLKMSLAVSADSTAEWRDFAVVGAVCAMQILTGKHAAGICSATILLG